MIQSGRNKFNQADESSVGKQHQVTTRMPRSTLHSIRPTITNHHHICCHVLDVAAPSTHTCDGIQPSGATPMWRFLRKTKGRVVRRRLLVGNHLKPMMAARDQAVARWRDAQVEDWKLRSFCLLVVAQATHNEHLNAHNIDPSHEYADAETSETHPMKIARDWITWANIIDTRLMPGLRRHGTKRRAGAHALLLGHLTRFV